MFSISALRYNMGSVALVVEGNRRCGGEAEVV
jgi:hypothetical protein